MKKSNYLKLKDFSKWFLLVLYILIIYLIIVFKLGDALILYRLTNHNRTVSEILSSINFIPFYTIVSYLINGIFNSIAIKNILGNILIFVPLGFLLCTIFSNMYIRKSILVSLLISFSCELSQVVINIGSGDIDDIILNVTGAILGIIIYNYILKHFNNNNIITSILN